MVLIIEDLFLTLGCVPREWKCKVAYSPSHGGLYTVCEKSPTPILTLPSIWLMINDAAYQLMETFECINKKNFIKH